MTKITYTVDIIKRDSAYYIDTTIEGQPVSSLGPIDDEAMAEAVQISQSTAVKVTIEQALHRLKEHLQQQRKAKVL